MSRLPVLLLVLLFLPGMSWTPNAALLRVEAYAGIAVERAAAGDRAGARRAMAAALEAVEELKTRLKTTNSSTDRKQLPMALSYIAAAQARIGDADGAVATIAKLPTDDDKSAAFTAVCRVGMTLSGPGQAAAAMRLAEVANTFQEKDGLRAYALAAAAVAQAKTGDRGRAERSLAGAHRSAEALHKTRDGETPLVAIFMARLEIGDGLGARETLARVLKHQRMRSGGDYWPRLISVALQAAAGETDEALTTAQAFAGFVDRATALALIAATRAGRGDRGEAARLIRLAEAQWARRGWLGLDRRHVPVEVAGRLGTDPDVGLLVTEIAADGPAARAGIVKGDVILALNGAAVTSVVDLDRLVGETPRDEVVEITIWGQDSARRVRIGLAEPPPGPGRHHGTSSKNYLTLSVVTHGLLGEVGRAAETARSISDEDYRVMALAILASALIETGDMAGARDAVRLALDASAEGSAPGQASPMAALGLIQAASGDVAGAFHTLRTGNAKKTPTFAVFARAAGQALTGNMSRATANYCQAISRLFAKYDGRWVPVATAVLLARLGDLTRAMDTAKGIGDRE